MSILIGKYKYYRDRIRLGSMSIKPEDLPFTTFIIGYFLTKTDGNIDHLFNFLDILEELKSDRLLSELLKMQILKLLQDFPKDIERMTLFLTDYKNGKNVDLIKWIESFYERGQKRQEIQQPVPLNNGQNEGTLELDNNSSYVTKLNQQAESKRQNEQRDIEFARKMQEEFDQEKVVGNDEDVPCEICFCELFDGAIDGSEKCGHFFHTNCLVETFKTNIQNNNFPILCPKEDCKVEMTEIDLKRIMQKPMFLKYQQNTLKAYADQHGDSISWCPTANCTYMFFFEKEDNERFECLECKKEYCLNCRVQWHKDMSCKEYKISATTSEEDKQFIEFVKGKKFKQCPKCKFWVEKNEGCDHMTCKCKFQFCYKCGGIYMKCQCVEQARLDQERRRVQGQERRRKKQERKRLAVEKAEKASRKKTELEKEDEVRKQKVERQTRSRRKR